MNTMAKTGNKVLQVDQGKAKSLALDPHVKETYEENHTYKPNGDNQQESIKQFQILSERINHLLDTYHSRAVFHQIYLYSEECHHR